jgi:hypothetical protein
MKINEKLLSQFSSDFAKKIKQMAKVFDYMCANKINGFLTNSVIEPNVPQTCSRQKPFNHELKVAPCRNLSGMKNTDPNPTQGHKIEQHFMARKNPK